MSRSSNDATVRGVDVTGEAITGTIVFVHGAVFQRKQWVPQRDALAEEFRVVTVDVPGHGARSDTDFRLVEAVDVLEEVFEREVDGPAILVGHSLGGYVVTAYAYRNPGDIEGLVVSGASANPVGRMETATRAVAGAARLATRSDWIESKVRGLAEKWVRERDLAPETKTEIVGGGFYPRQFGVAGPELAGRDFRSAFASFTGPSLVLNGEADVVMRRGEDEHAAAAEDARVEVVDGTGHVCNLDDATAFTDAVRRFGEWVLSDEAVGVER